MDLLCCESAIEIECRAIVDPVLLNDDRVLHNMLGQEEKYTPSTPYFSCVQKDVTAPMRTIVSNWMLEVCEAQKCQEEVFPLSMNYMDRFLSVCPIVKTQLQLLGTACLLLASKLREPEHLSASQLVGYTDHSFTEADLWSWELLVLSKLKWDMSAVTPHDFFDHILRRLPVDTVSWDIGMIRRHTQTFIALCARDYQFSLHPPSMIASASLAAALHGLEWTKRSGVSLDELLARLQHITGIEKDYLQTCLSQIEGMVTSMMHEANGDHSESSKLAELEHAADGELTKAETPTDVQDIHF